MIKERIIEELVRSIDPDFERIKKTPARVTRSLDEFFAGYSQNPEEIVADAIFDSEMDQMVLLKDISFESHCEHHLVPIIGKASVAYIPKGRILGASKLARLVDCFACRLQLQERMTMEIAQAVESVINPSGVAVYVEAEHFCLSKRGVKKEGAKLITQYFIGKIKNDYSLRSEFLAEVNR